MIIKTKQQGAEHLVRGIPNLFKRLGFLEMKKDLGGDEESMQTYSAYREVNSSIFSACEEKENPRLELYIYRDMHDVSANQSREEIVSNLECEGMGVSREDRATIIKILNAGSLDGLLFSTTLAIPPYSGCEQIRQLKDLIEGCCAKHNARYYPGIYNDTIRFSREERTFMIIPDRSKVPDHVVVRNKQEANSYIQAVEGVVRSIIKGVDNL